MLVAPEDGILPTIVIDLRFFSPSILQTAPEKPKIHRIFL
jgi:hypothetical protein